jgi:threonine dehydrogenase-like Zn-dependent dehydrogenase
LIGAACETTPRIRDGDACSLSRFLCVPRPDTAELAAAIAGPLRPLRGRERRWPLLGEPGEALGRLPTAWQAVEYAGLQPGESLVVLGLGPIGRMSCRVARHRGIDPVIGIDHVPDRLERARADGIRVVPLEPRNELLREVRELTDGRGPDAVIDAVGMEAHGAPLAAAVQRVSRLLPDRLEAAMLSRAGIDRLSALHLAIELVRRGGTISIVGVYGGMLDLLPMMTLFDKQIELRMGQANVRRWTDELLPLVVDGDPLGAESFASQHLPLEQAPDAYRTFQRKEDGTFKVVFQP